MVTFSCRAVLSSGWRPWRSPEEFCGTLPENTGRGVGMRQEEPLKKWRSRMLPRGLGASLAVAAKRCAFTFLPRVRAVFHPHPRIESGAGSSPLPFEGNGDLVLLWIPACAGMRGRRCRRRPPAEGLGVSPNCPFHSPKSGGQGVESSGRRFIEVHNWECPIMSGEQR